MKRWILTGFAMLSLLLVVASPTLAAPGGNSVAAAQCEDGGYLTYTRADGSSFKNEGQCTSYAAKGNALVPRPSFVLTFVASSTPGSCLPVLSLSGFEPGTYLVTFHPSTRSTSQIAVDEDGNGSVVGNDPYYLIANGTFVTAKASAPETNRKAPILTRLALSCTLPAT